jgi:hypothetical protein
MRKADDFAFRLSPFALWLRVPDHVPFVRIEDIDEALLSSGERTYVTFHRRFAAHIRFPILQWRFAPGRKFRADFGWPNAGIVLEIEGGAWMTTKIDADGTIQIGGRHVQGRGFEADALKYNEATALGLRILRFTPQQFDRIPAQCLDLIERTLDVDVLLSFR